LNAELTKTHFFRLFFLVIFPTGLFYLLLVQDLCNYWVLVDHPEANLIAIRLVFLRR